MEYAELTFPALIGIVVPWLVALVTNEGMSSTKKRWITIFVSIVSGLLVALGVANYYGVLNAEEIIKMVGVTMGMVSIVYAAFRNNGIKILSDKTSRIHLPEAPAEEEITKPLEQITDLPFGVEPDTSDAQTTAPRHAAKDDEWVSQPDDLIPMSEVREA